AGNRHTRQHNEGAEDQVQRGLGGFAFVLHRSHPNRRRRRGERGYLFSRRGSSVRRRLVRSGVHLDTPTIAEVSCSLSLRGTSGERGSFHRIVALFQTPSP